MLLCAVCCLWCVLCSLLFVGYLVAAARCGCSLCGAVGCLPLLDA